MNDFFYHNAKPYLFNQLRQLILNWCLKNIETKGNNLLETGIKRVWSGVSDTCLLKLSPFFKNKKKSTWKRKIKSDLKIDLKLNRMHQIKQYIQFNLNQCIILGIFFFRCNGSCNRFSLSHSLLFCLHFFFLLFLFVFRC